MLSVEHRNSLFIFGHKSQRLYTFSFSQLRNETLRSRQEDVGLVSCSLLFSSLYNLKPNGRHVKHYFEVQLYLRPRVSVDD
ncbi:hypothetical protein VZT92_006643 [Zoarces viviparus]|uniref:Uncharacterized protein n=1 Tax=Zoarces viviparus TaxID=48416 RepID=A0AAW1FQ38_ZOAVI